MVGDILDVGALSIAVLVVAGVRVAADASAHIEARRLFLEEFLAQAVLFDGYGDHDDAARCRRQAAYLALPWWRALVTREPQ